MLVQAQKYWVPSKDQTLYRQSSPYGQIRSGSNRPTISQFSFKSDCYIVPVFYTHFGGISRVN